MSEVAASASNVAAVIDLHTHSTVSDGSDSPARVAELAGEAGLKAFALTDHDRLDGLAEAGARAAELGVELVPGCELSCEHPGTMHVLVYDVEAGEGPLQDELVALQHARDTRNERMAERLAALGLPVTREEMEAEAGGIGVGRPHVAAILVRKGVVGSVQEAFDVWLAKGRPAYVEKERLAPADALRLARASGGRPVLAHPLSLGLDPPALAAAVRELADLGLCGIEAVYGRYTPSDRAGLVALAHKAGLVATGGSDHHGSYKPDLTVGTGTGDLAVPDEALAALRAR
ncbi:MAG: PHP domain-containing protein [Acidimicrobiaceae bacterium]|nr:PHP domain-containing protein [Acidimicrobiaceae bacterium]